MALFADERRLVRENPMLVHYSSLTTPSFRWMGVGFGHLNRGFATG
jgi:hypothetical protein